MQWPATKAAAQFRGSAKAYCKEGTPQNLLLGWRVSRLNPQPVADLANTLTLHTTLWNDWHTGPAICECDANVAVS